MSMYVHIYLAKVVYSMYNTMLLNILIKEKNELARRVGNRFDNAVIIICLYIKLVMF